MTVEQLLNILNKAVSNGSLSLLGDVRVRNLAVSQDQMDFGHDGYQDLAEVLFASRVVHLLIEADE